MPTIIKDNPDPDAVYCLHGHRPARAYQEEGTQAPLHTRYIWDLKSTNPVPHQQRAANYFANELAGRITPPCAIVVIPPSDKDTPKSGLHDLAAVLGQTRGIDDCGDVLIRHTTKTKARLGGDRGREANLKTMRVTDPTRIKGKRVLIIDDMMRDGGSMDAAKQHVVDAGAAHVERLALGCTSGATPHA